MPFHHDQKLDLIDDEVFQLKEWKIENPEKKEHWHKCESGDCVAVLEKEGKEFEVKILFPSVISRLYRQAGDEVSKETFLLQWLADGENIPSSGKYFTLTEKDSQQGSGGNG